MVPQTTSINFSYTVEEIVMMGRYAHIGRFSQKTQEDRDIINDLLKQFGLYKLKDRPFNELSGGELQKVIIARALAQQSKIVLFDEPTTFLDINYKIEFMEMLESLVRDGFIIIVILHDLNLAAQFCDKVLLLRDGKIKAFGTIEETLTKENIKEVYDLDTIVRKNIYTNSIFITPIKKSSSSFGAPEEYGKRKRIHVVAGGGSASELLTALKNYDVSAGVLYLLDDDYTLANHLNYKIISEAPFSPFSEDSINEQRYTIKNVDVVILTNIPFGKYNLKNLELLNETSKLILILEKNPIEGRDYTGGIAATIYNDLKKKENVKVVSSLNEIFEYINAS